MSQNRLRAAFYRGGTSNAVVVNAADLPHDQALRDQIFLHVLGSPDPYGRQLNGMGGGVSSLSKVVIVAPSDRPDADVDYTFVQVAVDAPVADYGSACGNMSSCVGPFAVTEGMVHPKDGEALVRIYSTNTNQIYHSRFEVKDGTPVEDGDFEIPGVAQTGAPITLDFLNPGGAATGSLLPSGNANSSLSVPGVGTFAVSFVDAANPVVFVKATELGCTATERPQDLDADSTLMAKLDQIRRAGAVAMGMAATPEAAKLSNPKIAIVAPPARFTALDGRSYEPASHDINIRLISMGNFHKALTLTGAMCAAVAAQIPNNLLHDIAGGIAELRIGNPSGVLPVRADVVQDGQKFTANSATTFRTQRRIMEGAVLYPAHLK
ncbi:2-methylaconitate cis-trans isomerase PrpF [Cognatishimia sp. WU-CL00825]|uniref:2-methylaconitate cis-trans isomerase PrpF family protein n=1 Tax=Cognatishimia sp. WU-CL00825 TaxID=3127658 RepID=UPI0031053984